VFFVGLSRVEGLTDEESEVVVVFLFIRLHGLDDLGGDSHIVEDQVVAKDFKRFGVSQHFTHVVNLGLIQVEEDLDIIFTVRN